jgi:DNA replication protein DnaC
MRLKQSRFPAVKALEDFNFTLQASVKKTLQLHLASNRYIDAGENVNFLGPPGTGKTHLAIALGVKACWLATTCASAPRSTWSTNYWRRSGHET